MVWSLNVYELHKRSSGFQDLFVTTFLTSYQLHDSIKHSKRTLRTEFENKYSHWPVFTRNIASHQWRKTPGCSCTPWANADITCAESIHGIGTTFKAHWLALYWLKLTFAYMRFSYRTFEKKNQQALHQLCRISRTSGCSFMTGHEHFCLSNSLLISVIVLRAVSRSSMCHNLCSGL